MSSAATIKFNMKDRPEFVRELRSKVNQYFKDNNISKHANLNMKLKTAFMIGLYFIPFILMVTGVFQSAGMIWLMWLLMGFGMSGIGLSIMHDANHGSYSKNQKVNNALGYLINFLGAYHVNWKIQHNVLHHTFTNIDGHDGDIENPIMRFSPTQPRKSFFRFQAFYAPFLYSLMTIYWFVSKDFERVVRYHKQDLLTAQGLTFSKALWQVVFNKVWYILLTLGLPLLVVDLPWYQLIGGFLMMHFVCGLFLALIFQPAHVIEETNFFIADEQGNLENNWAIHQLRTTANFANKSVLFSWFVGGLNFQIEHHLFPTICHIHYKKISKIVKATAEEYNIPYYQHKTFLNAVVSHFSMLNSLGTGSYDKKIAA